MKETTIVRGVYGFAEKNGEASVILEAINESEAFIRLKELVKDYKLWRLVAIE